MKKIAVILLFLALILPLYGCDEGVRIVGIHIEKYPDRIVYVANVDTELDFSGGLVRYRLKAGYDSSDADPMIDKFSVVEHNVDFTKPGIYEITITRGDNAISFPIQVVERDFIDKIVSNQGG